MSGGLFDFTEGSLHQQETIAVDVEDSNDLDIDVGGPKDIIACRCQHGSLYPGEGSTISIFSPFTSSMVFGK